MNKIAFYVFTFCLLSFLAVPAFAQSIQSNIQNKNAQYTTVHSPLVSGFPSQMQAVSQGNPPHSGTTASGDLQQRANKELTKRLTSLNDVLNKINGLHHISTDQKATLSANLQSEISNLKTLQTKINADTDQHTLRTDVQSIVVDYRVYLVYMPQIRTLIAADKVEDIVSQMNIIITKLQKRITVAQTGGTTTTSFQSALADMQTKLADAQYQAQNAISTVITLTPQGYPGNKTLLQNSREMLQKAREDIVATLADMKIIVTGLLRGEGKPSAFPSTEMTLSPTPIISQ